MNRGSVEITGSGPPVLFIHGLGSNATFFESVVCQIERRRTCIRYDLHGHGASVSSPVVNSKNDQELVDPQNDQEIGQQGVEGYVQDIVSLLRSLPVPDERNESTESTESTESGTKEKRPTGITDLDIVAHSLGTLIATTLASNAHLHGLKIHKLSLLGPRLALSPTARSDRLSRASLVLNHGFHPLLPTLLTHGKAMDLSCRSLVRMSILGTTREGYASACRALATALDPEYSHIEAEVMIIVGSEDVVTTPEDAQMLADKINGIDIKDDRGEDAVQVQGQDDQGKDEVQDGVQNEVQDEVQNEVQNEVQGQGYKRGRAKVGVVRGVGHWYLFEMPELANGISNFLT